MEERTDYYTKPVIIKAYEMLNLIKALMKWGRRKSGKYTPCYASNKYFAKELKSDIPEVQEMLRYLLYKNLIEVKSKNNQRVIHLAWKDKTNG